MLAAYAEDGAELSYDALRETAAALGWRTARRHSYERFSDLIADAAALPATEEGYVVRFSSGLRLKLKGAEYRRIHALVSRCTPLAIWEAIAAGDDLEAIRRDLPEEFWQDFAAIVGILSGQASAFEARVAAAAAGVSGLTDKELGLSLQMVADDATRPFLFGFRKTGKITGKARDSMCVRCGRPGTRCRATCRPRAWSALCRRTPDFPTSCGFRGPPRYAGRPPEDPAMPDSQPDQAATSEAAPVEAVLSQLADQVADIQVRVEALEEAPTPKQAALKELAHEVAECRAITEGR